MDGQRIRIRKLGSWLEKSLGVMFRRVLGSEVFLFTYGRPAERIFHTYFCPPLRILALTDEGHPLVDSVVQPGKFVRLPPARLIVECAPELDLTPIELRKIAEIAQIT